MGTRRHQNLVRCSRLLYEATNLRNVSNRVVADREVCFDRTKQDLTRVQSDTDGERARPKRIHPLDHPQCRLASADRVSLLRNRRAKQRHHAALVNAAYRSVMRVHRLSKDGKRGREAAHDVLRIGAS
jgi:hypothetical protein